MSRFWNSRIVYRSAGLLALGAAAPAAAQNLLVNPGFEAPPAAPGTQDATATGWSFV